MIAIILTIFATILGYAFIAGAVGSYDHSKRIESCGSSPKYCFSGRWCEHATLSFNIGLLWIVALPIVAGIAIGSRDPSSRAEKKRVKEIAAATHQAELARIRRMEDDELDRQLAKVSRNA